MAPERLAVKVRLRHHCAGNHFAGNQLKPADRFQFRRATAMAFAVFVDFAQRVEPVLFHPAHLRGGALDVGPCYGGQEPVFRPVHQVENPQVLAR